MTRTFSSPAQVPWSYTLRKTIGNRLFILKSRLKKIFGFRISRKRKKGTHFFRKRQRVLPGFWKPWGDTLSLSEREPALFEKNEIYCSALNQKISDFLISCWAVNLVFPKERRLPFRKRERVLPGFWKTWQDTLSLSKREPPLFGKKRDLLISITSKNLRFLDFMLSSRSRFFQKRTS